MTTMMDQTITTERKAPRRMTPEEVTSQMTSYLNQHVSIMLKASILDQVFYEAVKICREIPEADAMAEDTFIDDRNNFRWKDVLNTGLRVFIAGIDGATGVAQVSGGSGTSNDMPW
ncbi:MAG: hypothetical protein K6F94_02550, partial [Bacteroidaceae bacterium]|nr:hypothetical protein [Bacteroidaceae bacterium]